ncbi:MAG: MHS family MFS transporter [Phycisphaerae bacterium]|nr:MHS family MFS transporter [Phycisphaerae bacterium]
MATTDRAGVGASPPSLTKVIAASSAGTLIEWYDFYIFGALAFTLADVFFPKASGAAALLGTLATFAIGFVVRPFGALLFGYIGDRVGRKYTFMLTLLLMGGATFLIGVLPGFAVHGGWPGIGWAAPTLLVVLRLLQGLALGGEYGGAATYVAEHAPEGRRGFWTSWIQTTATLGLLLSLAVILGCRSIMSPEQFAAWGWRIPFWLSIVLVAFSYYIRRRMDESPAFKALQRDGKVSRNPFKESFANWANLRIVLIALFGATAGQGVVWYTGQFYALNFIKGTLKINATQAEFVVGAALIAATPFFIVFGALSDRIGRRPIMIAGCALAVLAYYPIYMEMQAVATDAAAALASGAGGAGASAGSASAGAGGSASNASSTALTLGGASAWKLGALVWIQVLFVTMVYGPIAAYLVELFPTRIRYSSMSLPYHIGNGVFGGMVPFIGQLLVERTKNPLSGLWYPMAVATLTVIVGLALRSQRSAPD